MTAHEASTAVPVAPPARRFSILPATTVLLLAVITLVIVGATNALDTSQVAPTTLPVVLGGLPPASAKADASLFNGAVQDGEPPANVASALIAPRGTTWIKNLDTGGATEGDYDRAASFRVGEPRSKVFGFYRSNLEALRWSLFSSGTAPQGQGDELLFQKEGDDGWYWESGVIALPTSDGQTTWTYRMFQVSDSS